MKKTVRYRLDVNYLTRDYEDWALETSAPIYTKQEGIAEYNKAVTEIVCVDDETKPARVHLWKYAWNESGRCTPITILKNY